jgi:hypothetical protein
MARLPKKTVRKLVTLPLETAEWAEQFRIRTGATSESDAFKTLIESGLQRFDTREMLFVRCEAATSAGKSIGDIINFVLADHPLISNTTFDSAALCAYLKADDPDEPSWRFRFSRHSKKWFWEFEHPNDHDWRELRRPKAAPPDDEFSPPSAGGGGRPAAAARSKAELDDDIPF